MEINLSTVLFKLLSIVLINLIVVTTTINVPSQLNQFYYRQQHDHLRAAQYQRYLQQQQQQQLQQLQQLTSDNQLVLSHQQLNQQPVAQKLVQEEEEQFNHENSDQQQPTTESIETLIEQEKLRVKQIKLIQERQRQQKEQLQQLGVHLVCDAHLCSASNGVFGTFDSSIASGGSNGQSDGNNIGNMGSFNGGNNNNGNNNNLLQFKSALAEAGSPVDPLVDNKQCSCDSTCTKYGDCCLDSVSSKTLLDHKYHGGFKRDSPWRHWQCTTLRMASHSIHILTIGGCSRFWPRKPGDSTKEKCEEVDSDMVTDDPFLSVPIYSQRTHQNYRNLYCAVCNYDASFASTWETFTMCVKNDTQGHCSKSFVYFEKPKGVDLHPCFPTDYDACPQSLTIMNEETIKCGLYYAPVKLASDLTAKNEWCATCNNQTIIGSRCLETRPTYERPPVNLGAGRHFSLPVILDIDFTTGGLIVGTQERCPPNNVYDPWKRACRVVTCDLDAQLEGDRCVPTSDVHLDGTSLTFNHCPKISFNPEEYTIYPNGTVYITSRDKYIDSGHYRIDMVTQKLSICAHSYVILIGKFSSLHDYLSNFGTSVSIISLCIKIVLFFCGTQPRRTANIAILFLCISLLLAQSLFLFGIQLTSNHLVCSIIGIGIHYLYLASFFWMNVLSYDIFCTFSMERLNPQVKISSSRQIIFYSFYGWFTPLLVILSSTLVDQYARTSILAPNYGHEICWVSNRLALLVFFAMPVAILLIINTVFFAFTATRINKISKIGKLARENVAIRRKTFIIYTKLFLIMGLTWIFGFIAAYGKNSFLWSLFIVFNSLQGFYILIAFTDIKWDKLRNLIHCPLQSVANSSSSIATATTISTEQ